MSNELVWAFPADFYPLINPGLVLLGLALMGLSLRGLYLGARTAVARGTWNPSPPDPSISLGRADPPAPLDEERLDADDEAPPEEEEEDFYIVAESPDAPAEAGEDDEALDDKLPAFLEAAIPELAPYDDAAQQADYESPLLEPPLSPTPVELLAAAFQSACVANPAIEKVLGWSGLNPAAIDAADPAALDEAVRIAACWEWLTVIGAAVEEQQLLLGQLGPASDAAINRLSRLFGAVGAISPALEIDGTSQRASEMLVSGVAGAGAMLIWPEPGSGFNASLHIRRGGEAKTPQVLIATLICPGLRTSTAVLVRAIVTTRAQRSKAPAVQPSSRRLDLHFLPLLHSAEEASVSETPDHTLDRLDALLEIREKRRKLQHLLENRIAQRTNDAIAGFLKLLEKGNPDAFAIVNPSYASRKSVTDDSQMRIVALFEAMHEAAIERDIAFRLTHLADLLTDAGLDDTYELDAPSLGSGTDPALVKVRKGAGYGHTGKVKLVYSPGLKLKATGEQLVQPVIAFN